MKNYIVAKYDPTVGSIDASAAFVRYIDQEASAFINTLATQNAKNTAAWAAKHFAEQYPQDDIAWDAAIFAAAVTALYISTDDSERDMGLARETADRATRYAAVYLKQFNNDPMLGRITSYIRKETGR